MRQRQGGRVAFPLRIPLGDLSSEKLRLLAEVTEQTGAEARLTPAQGILLVDLPDSEGERIAKWLLERDFLPSRPVSIARCAGTDT
jgi:sulfite reductase beta subunit-like hemoprotein